MDQGLADNLATVQARIAAACTRSGRSPSEVTLLAVTKIFPASAILAAYDLGLRQFGENYVQEFDAKAPLVRHLPDARFHFIGHLQSNKSRPAAELFDVIQTIDSPKLARRLDESGKPLDVMIEVKLSPEVSKHGCLPQDLPALLDAIRACPSLRLTGLMTMPPWSDDPELSRPYFIRLRELAEVHQLSRLSHLSMGMSHDLEVAIEEGSTMVRIGTALFGSRKGLL